MQIQEHMAMILWGPNHILTKLKIFQDPLNDFLQFQRVLDPTECGNYRILREISFGESRMSKTAVLAIFWGSESC